MGAALALSCTGSKNDTIHIYKKNVKYATDIDQHKKGFVIQGETGNNQNWHKPYYLTKSPALYLNCCAVPKIPNINQTVWFNAKHLS